MKKTLFFIITVLFLSYCSNNPSGMQQTDIAQSSNKTGKELAEIYCGNCHKYPEPNLLDKITWAKELLPNMGARLGIKTPNYDPLKSINGLDRMMIEAENIYPNTPLINQQDWEKIVAFYKNEAPDTLKLNELKTPILPLKGFTIKPITQPNFPPLVTLAKIDERNKSLFIGSLEGKLSVFSTKNKELTLENTFNGYSPKVSILQPNNDQILVLNVGTIHPNEQQEGNVQQINKATKQSVQLFSMLRRPVWFASSDNGNSDILVCEYGYQKGQLSYYKKVEKTWKSSILSDTAGAIKALPYDFNKDGLNDFAVLMAQGDEHINIYYAQKNGSLRAKQVLQFPPIYGSSDMQLVDFNKDGFMDILYTNGDNEDFSPVLKPYHGVRVFLNDGKDNFTEGAFFPMNGAFQAKAADFDLDGDVDIVVASFFPKDKKPESHFLYFEQTKPNEFLQQTFPQATQGKWMTMDAGDADGDGDMDILLGSFVISLAGNSNSKPIDKNEKIIPFLFLENKAK
jgi:FG-GAP-like repeat